MNARAAELGLDDTSYVDISGRDPEDLNENGDFPAQAGCEGNEFDDADCAHYTTARDLASLARVALDSPLFAQIVNTPEWTTTTWAGATRSDPTRRSHHQPAACRAADEYSGAYGVKTGTTHRSGQNLVSAAPCAVEGRHRRRARLRRQRHGPGDRFTDSRALLDFGLDR